jgi:hypothetical protein
MSSEPFAVRFCRRWVTVYTHGLPAEIGQHRLLEIESDLWEHLHDSDTADREILGRTLRGIHGDVWWRYRTLLENRGARQRSHDMTAATRDWWTPMTTVLGIVVSTMGLLGLMLGDTGGASGGLLLAAGLPTVGGLVILGGMWLRRRRRVDGSRLVLAGAVLAALEPILIPISVFVVMGGLWTGHLVLSAERAATIRLEVPRRSLTDRWYRWIIAGVGLGSVGIVTLLLSEHSVVVPESCTEANPCWQGTAAWATWILSWLAAMVTGGVGVLLGLLRLRTRHHTRPA